MWLHATCQIELYNPVDTPFLFMLRARSGWNQWVGREKYIISPNVPVVEFTDSFGNLCQRIVAPAGEFNVSTSAKVQCAEFSETGYGAPFFEVQNLPHETLPFLLPSRYCESDRFREMVVSIVDGCYAGYDQVAAIVDYIRRTKVYSPGMGNDIISACETNERTHAVCRDMAHLGIACCRALSIPARMVVGYLEGLEPMDLHAWFEAYVGGRWYTFDPTQSDLSGGRIVIAYGRDAADVAVFTQFGDPTTVLDMRVTVEQMSAPPV